MSATNFILFDDNHRNHLLPFTFTRPVCDIRCGILTIREKWEKLLSAKTSSLSESYLQKKFPAELSSDNLLINGALFPSDKLLSSLLALKKGEALISNENILGIRLDENGAKNFSVTGLPDSVKKISFTEKVNLFRHNWEIFKWNEQAIADDFELLTKNRKSAKINDTNKLIHPEKIFIEDGADVNYAVLNASKGYIYIGKNSTIMEGVTIRGPFALGEYSEIKMQAKIYGATTIGPHCKVGGEINNSVIFGYSNKAHDGFLGNSVIGEWCNLGADTNNSNLKNDYSEVKLWNYVLQSFEKTGLQFCGLMMGDHSKCGINTMFNTGTVVGVFANIFGAGFPRQVVPSFSWGGATGFTEYKIDKAMEVAKLVMERRNISLTEIDKEILMHIYKLKEK